MRKPAQFLERMKPGFALRVKFWKTSANDPRQRTRRDFRELSHRQSPDQSGPAGSARLRLVQSPIGILGDGFLLGAHSTVAADASLLGLRNSMRATRRQ